MIRVVILLKLNTDIVRLRTYNKNNLNQLQLPNMYTLISIRIYLYIINTYLRSYIVYKYMLMLYLYMLELLQLELIGGSGISVSRFFCGPFGSPRCPLLVDVVAPEERIDHPKHRRPRCNRADC